jgi:hypothetical protein
MAETDPMNVDERRKYLHKMRIRYWQAKRKSKRGRLLDEMEAVTGLHRKSLLRLVNGTLARTPRRKQRGKTYGPEVDGAISKIATSLDYPCAERLKPNLVWMANHLEAHGELNLTAELREQLGMISVSSLRRRGVCHPTHRPVQRLAAANVRPKASHSHAPHRLTGTPSRSL